MTAAVLGGLLAGLGIAMPVGAIGAYLVGLGARAPRPVAAAAALGVASTDGGYALLAVLGGAALEEVLRPAKDWLRWSSVGVLVVLAVVTVAAGVRRYRARGPAAAPRQSRLTAPRAYVVLLGLTALNPATLAYFTALVLGTQAHTTATGGERAVFVAAVFVASAAWQLTLVATGAAVGHLAGGRRGSLGVALASGLVMLGLAAKLAL
jgi:arginine exporter protein ArgO